MKFNRRTKWRQLLLALALLLFSFTFWLINQRRLLDQTHICQEILFLMQKQPELANNSVEQSIILHQSILNVLETNNSNYLMPIPIEKKIFNIIFSSWRSGSTFLGDLLSVVPATYYHYEPFNFYTSYLVADEKKHVDHLRNLLLCNFSGDMQRSHINVAGHWKYNRYLWSYCEHNKFEFCKQIAFRENFCKIFPRHTMKLVRAPLSMARSLMNDSQLNVKIILQIRDPRGVANSKYSFQNCGVHNPDFCNITKYCENMVLNYHEAKRLSQIYPTKIMEQRYEDLAFDPFQQSQKLYDFLKLPYDDKVLKFINAHTTSHKGDSYSTFRESSKAATRWMEALDITAIQNVQLNCSEAMKLWGYIIVKNKKELENGYPMRDII